MSVLTIGLLGVASALVVSNGGVSAGITRGQSAVERGFAVSVATMLAQERLEQIKRLQYKIGGTDAIGSSPGPPTGFTDEAFGSISGYPNYSRIVRVESPAPAANMKTITVTVRYRYSSGAGMSEEGLGVSTIISARP